ncbi:MAG: hypothetical protein ACKVG0_09725, partial [Alphaproteobacteria bacterium]
MDHEGYGKSSRTDGYSYILDGVEDLKAAVLIIEKATGQSEFSFFGTSSGALRAGAFCNACPERVERSALSAFPYTGKGAPSLIKRAERLDEWQATNSREVNEAYFLNMFTRDTVGLTVPELPAIAAAAEMANGGGSVPNGNSRSKERTCASNDWCHCEFVLSVRGELYWHFVRHALATCQNPE